MDEKYVTGQHDLSHNMQLAWGDLMNEDACLKDKINDIYSVMSEYNAGKARTHFMEFAAEMKAAVLTNKSKCETRFVRSDLRSLDTYLRNIPTFYHFLGEKLKNCIEESDNTNAKIIQNQMKRLNGGQDICIYVGFAVILQAYSEASLMGQSSSTFPTTVFKCMLELSDKLSDLHTEWKWPRDPLKFVSVGAPKEIIDHMQRNLEYNPFVNKGAQIHHKQKMSSMKKDKIEIYQAIQEAGIPDNMIPDVLGEKIPFLPTNSNVVNEDEEGENQNDDEESDVEGEEGEKESFLHSSCLIENFDEEGRLIAEAYLEKIAAKLSIKISERLQLWEEVLKGYDAFENLEWVKDPNPLEIAKERLKRVLEVTDVYRHGKFEFNDCLVGYLKFVQFVVEKRTKSGIDQLEKIYKLFYEKFHDDKRCSTFIDMFEYVQIKGFREAVKKKEKKDGNFHHLGKFPFFFSNDGFP